MRPETLRALRGKWRISQSELGRRVGRSQTEISLIEAGDRTIPRDLARQIQEALARVPRPLAALLREALNDSSHDEVTARGAAPGAVREVVTVLMQGAEG